MQLKHCINLSSKTLEFAKILKKIEKMDQKSNHNFLTSKDCFYLPTEIPLRAYI